MGFDIDLLGPPDDGGDDALAHYGVKGMRWGFRKKDNLSGRRPSGDAENSKSKFSVEDFDKIAARPSANQAPPKKPPSDEGSSNAKFSMADFEKIAYKSELSPSAELRQNQEKFMAKADPSDPNAPPGSGLSSARKKQLAYIAAGSLAVAAVGYGTYKLSKGESLVPAGAKAAWFNSSVTMSKLSSWTGTGYIKESSYARRGFELPAGHTFNRISTYAETSFKSGGTYATHSPEDFRRYVVGFRHELGMGASLNHVTWTAKKPIKVPDLTETLDGLREAMEKATGSPVSPESVKRRYEQMSGGKWDDALSSSFFSVLKERGFSAIVDEMDAGVIGETPLVMFDTDAFTAKQSKPLTLADINRHTSKVKNFPKPPRK